MIYHPTPLKTILAIATMAAGIFLYVAGREFLPPLYGNARIAILIMAAAIALAIIRFDLQGIARTVAGLAVMAALAGASILALIEPYQAGKLIVQTFINWRSSGQTLTASWNASSRILASYRDVQSQALNISLLIGTPVLIAGLLYLIGKAIPVAGNRVAKSGPWKADWLSNREIVQLKHNGKGLPLGLLNGAILRYKPNAKQGWRAGHHAVIAGTRAGKGVSAVIPAIIDHDGPVVVLDIKGENFAITRRHRQSLGREVIVLNPFGVIEPSHNRFNPLAYIRPDHLVRDIEVIAEGLVRPEQGNGTHFSETAKTVIAAVIEVIVTTSDKQDLVSVMDWLFASGFKTRLQSWADDPHTFGSRASSAAATLLSAGDNERGAIMTTIKKAFDWARSDEMRSFLSHTNCNLDDVFADHADLFLVVPLDQVDSQAVFMRLFSNIILGMAVRQEGKRKTKKNLLLVLDEFVRLGRMEKLINIANVAAGSGIEALFITQDKGQIESVYGKGDTASILGACVTIRVFGLGRAETVTAQWAADALGDQTVLSKTQQPTKMGEVKKYSVTEQRQKLMTADQILEMKTGKMLLLTGSKRPLMMDAIISHQHPAYRRKLAQNPVV